MLLLQHTDQLFLTHDWDEQTQINIFLRINVNVAIGKPKTKAVSVPAPAVIANAVPRIPPVTTSGGIDAPTEKEPMKANSKVAPMITPVFNIT